MKLLAPLALCILAPLAGAQSVIVVWGDSVLSGWNSHAAPGTPWGAAPFGDPVHGAFRWDGAAWAPVTPRQSTLELGADPVYGLCAGWRRFFGGDVYVVGMGIPGSDVDPAFGNGSWHPLAGGWMLPALLADLAAALATLPDPHVDAVMFSGGNNHPSQHLVGDLEAVNDAVLDAASAGGALPAAPLQIGVRAWVLASGATAQNRHSMPLWELRAPQTERRVVLDATTFPARTGGLPDGVHLTEFGAIFLGYYGAVLALWS